MASEFLSHTWQRDKVLSIVQFLPSVVEAPLKATGNITLAKALCEAAVVADGYRTMTRFSGIIDVLNPKTLQSASSIKDPVVKYLGIGELVTTLGFFATEHAAFLSHWNILPKDRKPRWANLCIWFWLWSLFMADTRQIYQLVKAYPYLNPHSQDIAAVRKQVEFKRTVLGFLKSLLFTLFALSLISTVKPVMFAGSTNIIARIANKAVAVTTPPALPLTTGTRGLCALTASIIDIYLTVTK